MSDYSILASQQTVLLLTDLQAFTTEQVLVDFGAIMICRRGMATLRVDFREWQLREGSVITLFPNDMVFLPQTLEDYQVEMMRFDQAMLREAS